VSRGRVFLGAAAAGLVALVVVLFVWDRVQSGESPSADRPAIEARTDLSPRTVLFGDTVTALVEVTLDRKRVDPDSVRVEADFAPWKPVAKPERSRSDRGTTTSLRFSYVLRCLGNRCITTDEDLVILDKAIQAFGRVRVTYKAPDGAAQNAGGSLQAPWPRLLVGARFSARDAQAVGTSSSGWRADLDSMPAVTYRMSPGLFSALLLAGGALLAVAGGAFAYRVRPRRTASTVSEPSPREPVLTPLERALALLELSERVDGAADQRRALELVAASLAERGNPKLALTSRALAWSRSLPTVADTNGLAVRARSALRNGAE
jgi:hypothetical protein